MALTPRRPLVSPLTPRRPPTQRPGRNEINLRVCEPSTSHGQNPSRLMANILGKRNSSVPIPQDDLNDSIDEGPIVEGSNYDFGVDYCEIDHRIVEQPCYFHSSSRTRLSIQHAESPSLLDDSAHVMNPNPMPTRRSFFNTLIPWRKKIPIKT